MKTMAPSTMLAPLRAGGAGFRRRIRPPFHRAVLYARSLGKEKHTRGPGQGVSSRGASGETRIVTRRVTSIVPQRMELKNGRTLVIVLNRYEASTSTAGSPPTV